MPYIVYTIKVTSQWAQWRHQRHECLLNLLFRRRPKKTSKFRDTALCAGIHLWPVNSPHKGSVTGKMFPFDDVIMLRWFSTASRPIYDLGATVHSVSSAEGASLSSCHAGGHQQVDPGCKSVGTLIHIISHSKSLKSNSQVNGEGLINLVCD